MCCAVSCLASRLAGRAGGAYIPPFRLARMMADIDDKNSAAAQKLSWEALRKSLNGLINKVGNIYQMHLVQRYSVIALMLDAAGRSVQGPQRPHQQRAVRRDTEAVRVRKVWLRAASVCNIIRCSHCGVTVSLHRAGRRSARASTASSLRCGAQ